MSRRRAAEFWLLVGVLALAGLLRGSGLAAQPLRGDEGFSVRFARLPLANMAAAFAVSEPNPPLQFLFLKGWLALAGESEFALRWPSVLAGLLGVAVVVPAGRALAGRRAARLAALWLALSPFLIWYSQDIRIYAALSTTTLAAGWATWVAARRGRPRHWLAAGGLWWLALQLHYFAAVTLAAVGLAWLLTSWARARWRPAALTAALAGLAYLPWVLYVWPLLSGHTKSWLTRLPAGEMLFRTLVAYSVGGAFAGADGWLPTLGALLLGGLLCAGLAVAVRGDRPRALWLVALGPATPLLLGLLSLYRPVYSEHYAVAGLAGSLLLAALGAAALPRPGRRAAAAGLSVLALAAVQNYRFDPAFAKSPDWRGLAQYLRAAGRPAEVILVNLPDPAFEYYYRGPQPVEEAPPGPLAEVGVEAAEAQVQRLLGQYQHLRFLFAPSPGYDPEGWVGQRLDACCEKTADLFVGPFRVQAYDTPAGSLAARQPFAAAFEGGPALTGYRWLETAGGTAHLTLFWTTRAPLAEDYTVFVHVLAADGFQLLGADGPPRAGAQPTSRWAPGADVIDPRPIVVGDLPPGNYAVEIGLYAPATGARLPLNAGGDTLRLPEPLKVPER